LARSVDLLFPSLPLLTPPHISFVFRFLSHKPAKFSPDSHRNFRFVDPIQHYFFLLVAENACPFFSLQLPPSSPPPFVNFLHMNKRGFTHVLPSFHLSMHMSSISRQLSSKCLLLVHKSLKVVLVFFNLRVVVSLRRPFIFPT